MKKAVDLVLLLAVLVGGIVAWQTGRERRRLGETYDRLSRVTGDLAITDPSKLHVAALETGEPLHFAWRVYVPPNYRLNLFSGTGGSSSTWSSSSGEFIARVRFRQVGCGPLEVYTHFSGGSSSGGHGGTELAELIRGKWDRVVVEEQVGKDRLTAIGPGKSAVLLRLRLPDDLVEEAKKTLRPYRLKQFVPVFYELKLGPSTSPP